MAESPNPTRSLGDLQPGEWKSLVSLAPTWDEGHLANAVRLAQTMATKEGPGAFLETPVLMKRELGVIAMDFDGEGRVLINPMTFQTKPGRELARVLRVHMGPLAVIGEWKDGRAVVYKASTNQDGALTLTPEGGVQ